MAKRNNSDTLSLPGTASDSSGVATSTSDNTKRFKSLQQEHEHEHEHERAPNNPTPAAANKAKVGAAKKNNKLNKNDQKWMDSYQHLLDYKSKHGHTYIPLNAGDFLPGPIEDEGYTRGRIYLDKKLHSLAKWCARQRQAKKSGNLRADREKLLNDIDFYFCNEDYFWDKYYDDIVEIKKEVGHVDIPSLRSQQTKENEVYGSFMAWANEQRLRYTLYQKKYKTTINERRIKKLNEIGFAWYRDEEDKARLDKKAESTNLTYIMRHFRYYEDQQKLMTAIRVARKKHEETGEPTIAEYDEFRLVGKQPDGTFFTFHVEELDEIQKKGNGVICFGFQ